MEVSDTTDNLVGTVDSATEGTVSQQQIQSRPDYRVGDMLEDDPGLVVTQHSGEGKANQYFLRGMNLDHGTDLRISVDGMDVNERTNAHGQGYSDINFMIPELVSSMQYRKGPYYAAYGDFASVGAVEMNYYNVLPKAISTVTVGEWGYYRDLLADSIKMGPGNLLFAIEGVHDDGPWTRAEDFRKMNGVLRFSEGDELNGFNITAMGYDCYDDATNQIPLRAVNDGSISPFGTENPSDFINTFRYSLSSAWQRTSDDSITKVNAYIYAAKMKLFNDFTYFLNYPPPAVGQPAEGDQFEQSDRRVTCALNASQTWMSKWWGHDVENTIGLQVQNDNIFDSLYHTRDRIVLSTTRLDHVEETSEGVYLENAFHWLDKFRTVAGIRKDFYQFNDNCYNIPVNSGKEYPAIASPKLNLIFGPWAKTEYFINMGEGFHSNDARGLNTTKAPDTGSGTNLSTQRVTPLVRSEGFDIGARTGIIPGLESSLTFFMLKFASEITFDGDAGQTDTGRPSLREGFEFANTYKPAPWLTINADFAYTRARFTAPDPDPTVFGDHIPGAPEGVGSIGAAVDNIGRFFGSLVFQYLGPYPLIENDSERSKGSKILNGQVGYKITKDLKFQLEAFNLLDSKDHDIDYWYESRLATETKGVYDDHFKPVEPFTVRGTVTYNF
ncbi:MAG: TonB-dependent receptor [Nitrospirota bacterium]